MEINLDIIKQFEGLKLKAYLCPANVVTIGYGSTRYLDGSRIKMGDRITIEQAEELLAVDAERRRVAMALPAQLNVNQVSALVSWHYNCGQGAWMRSGLRRKVIANYKDEAIRDEFMKWTRAGGQVLRGLVRRRTAEADLYFKPL